MRFEYRTGVVGLMALVLFSAYGFAATPKDATLGEDDFISAREGRPAPVKSPVFPRPSSVGAHKAIKLFIQKGNNKLYLAGYHWTSLSLSRKIGLIEAGRRAALQMGAVITLPAEAYVGELNRFYSSDPALLKIEVGEAMQGIAIALKDWDTGSRGSASPPGSAQVS